MALFGQKTGYSNVVIENNDVTGNLVAGVFNNAGNIPNLVIRNNLGHNPVGVIPTVAFPNSGAPFTNQTGLDSTIYITSGTTPITIAINGVTLNGVTVPGGGAVGSPIRLPANQNITLTYGPGGAPSWQWVAD